MTFFSAILHDWMCHFCRRMNSAYRTECQHCARRRVQPESAQQASVRQADEAEDPILYAAFSTSLAQPSYDPPADPPSSDSFSSGGGGDFSGGGAGGDY